MNRSSHNEFCVSLFHWVLTFFKRQLCLSLLIITFKASLTNECNHLTMLNTDAQEALSEFGWSFVEVERLLLTIHWRVAALPPRSSRSTQRFIGGKLTKIFVTWKLWFFTLTPPHCYFSHNNVFLHRYILAAGHSNDMSPSLRLKQITSVPSLVWLQGLSDLSPPLPFK